MDGGVVRQRKPKDSHASPSSEPSPPYSAAATQHPARPRAALHRWLVTWILNALNLLVFICTYGRETFTEGRFYRLFSKWVNWNFYFNCKPKNFCRPVSEEQICDYVKRARKVRVVGGGHSFNPGTLCEDTLITLDNYNKVVNFDKKNGVITVQAGIRLRAFYEAAEKGGWDLPVMGTANIQSIAGLVATDLHATGNKSGFLSQQILSIRIVNNKGEAETFSRDSDVFKCALGGIGALGVVVEVTLQLVPKFLVKRVTRYVDRLEAEEAVDANVRNNAHVGYFYIGGVGAKRIRLTTYNPAKPNEHRTSCVRFKNFCAQIFDLTNGGFLLSLARYFPFIVNTGYLIWNNTFLGQPFIDYAGDTFTTHLFFRHDEMEYAMPYKEFRPTIGELMDFLNNTRTVSLMEVRFTTKEAQTLSLLGPGAGRDTAWIEILPTLDHDSHQIYSLTEQIFKNHGGRPHLGKYTTYQRPDMEKYFNKESVQQWLAVREKQDPEKKFVNAFVQQVFLDNFPSDPHHCRY